MTDKITNTGAQSGPPATDSNPAAPTSDWGDMAPGVRQHDHMIPDDGVTRELFKPCVIIALVILFGLVGGFFLKLYSQMGGLSAEVAGIRENSFSKFELEKAGHELEGFLSEAHDRVIETNLAADRGAQNLVRTGALEGALATKLLAAQKLLDEARSVASRQPAEKNGGELKKAAALVARVEKLEQELDKRLKLLDQTIPRMQVRLAMVEAARKNGDNSLMALAGRFSQVETALSGETRFGELEARQKELDQQLASLADLLENQGDVELPPTLPPVAKENQEQNVEKPEIVSSAQKLAEQMEQLRLIAESL